MDGQPISMFDVQNNYFPIGIIAMESARELGQKIDSHLMSWYFEEKPEAKDNMEEKKSMLIKASCPRFNTGDAKGVLGESVRGYDIYILTDVITETVGKVLSKAGTSSVDNHTAGVAS